MIIGHVQQKIAAHCSQADHPKIEQIGIHEMRIDSVIYRKRILISRNCYAIC
jgi:hypothetical protein